MKDIKTFKEFMRAELEGDNLKYFLSQTLESKGRRWKSFSTREFKERYWESFYTHKKTSELYDKYILEIWMLVHDVSERTSQSFLHVINDGCELYHGESQIYDVPTFKEAMVWCAAEECAKEILEESVARAWKRGRQRYEI